MGFKRETNGKHTRVGQRWNTELALITGILRLILRLVESLSLFSQPVKSFSTPEEDDEKQNRRCKYENHSLVGFDIQKCPGSEDIAG